MPIFRLILVVLLLIVGLVLLVWKNYTDVNGNKLNLRKYGVLALGGSLFFLLLACVRVVPANTVGIPTTVGSIGQPMSPGLQFVLPITEIHTFSTRLQESSMLATLEEGDRVTDDSIEVRGSDSYAMNVDITIRYYVGADSASDLFRRVGDMDGIRERIVRPEAREVVRIAFGHYTSENSYTSGREQVSVDINELMEERLAPYGIILDRVDVRNVNPEERLRVAIGERAAARERATQAVIEQEQRITEAETARREAEIHAEAARLAAQGEADANRLVAESLTPELLQQQYFDALREGNTVFVPENSDVIVDGRSEQDNVTPPVEDGEG